MKKNPQWTVISVFKVQKSPFSIWRKEEKKIIATFSSAPCRVAPGLAPNWLLLLLLISANLTSQKWYIIIALIYISMTTERLNIFSSWIGHLWWSQNFCWSLKAKNSTWYCVWECKLVQSLWKTEWRFLKKLKIEIPYDPAIPLSEMYSKKMKTLTGNDLCAPKFIASLFTISKLWKQPKCPSVDEWIKKLWYI